VCGLERFEVRTKFTGAVERVAALDLAGPAEPGGIDVLREVFTDPGAQAGGDARERREAGSGVVRADS